MPQGQRSADVRKVESPVAEDRSIVVEPPPHASRQGVRELSRHELAELAAHGLAVDVGDELPERAHHLLGRRPHHRRGLALEVLLELTVTAASGGNLREVLLRHTGEPVEALGINRGGRRDRRGGDHPVR
jgi:hypothetical protein